MFNYFTHYLTIYRLTIKWLEDEVTLPGRLQRMVTDMYLSGIVRANTVFWFCWILKNCVLMSFWKEKIQLNYKYRSIEQSLEYIDILKILFIMQVFYYAKKKV